MLKVKVCGMRDLDNIHELVKLKPDFMGLIFYPKSPRYVPREMVIELSEKYDGIKKVGVFVNEDYKTIVKTIRNFNLDAVQLHGNEEPRLCAELRDYAMIIKAFGIENVLDFKRALEYEGVADCFLFDTKIKSYGGSGVKFDWNILNNLETNKPFFLSGGISLEDALSLKHMDVKNMIGVDINSCFETSPGVKDISLVSQFIDKIRNNYDYE